MSRCHHWKPLVYSFHKRLSKWKSKSLSFGGRHTLIRSVLGSLGVYYFSNFKAPKEVIRKLESIRRNVFWGGCSDENKISWIAWDKILSPLSKRGLGITSLRVCNQAMLTKWWWRFKTEEHAIWCKVICSIHGLRFKGYTCDYPLNWKWEDVIVIDDVDVPNEVTKTENNAEVKEEHVTLDVPNQHDIVDDDVLPAPIKRNEDVAENKNPWEVYDEVADEDVGDDENEVDDEDEWI
nr:reverse transcriptase domain, reverse transcriptase zinc-binding domain protein [Tanacetum cinerariifolium]